jgi:hypothetical protein
MADIGTSLCTAFDVAWARFTARLDGLETAEYLWEPVSGCWSIHQDTNGRWRIDGSGSNAPAGDPPPVTTLAWRIGHVAGLGLGGFASQLFENGSLTIQDIEFPGEAAAVPEFCKGYYRMWREGMAGLDDARWWSALGEKWGPYQDSNTVDLALHLLDEVVHHGGEIGLLRDLYLRRAELSD